jgi:hypothetical protein
MIAAVTDRAFDVAAELAPAGVDVRRLPDGQDAAAFVLLDWSDRETLDALPQLEALRVVQNALGREQCASAPSSLRASPVVSRCATSCADRALVWTVPEFPRQLGDR